MPKIDSPAVLATREMKNISQNSPAEAPAPEQVETLTLTPEQEARYANDIYKIEYARIQRDQKRTEFDGMTYEADYRANQNAANAYLWPKKNDSEVRVVTSTTEKRMEVLSNEIMSMNLQAELLAYDQHDNEIRELGRDMADIIKRTEQIERAEDVDQSALRELITQRALFAQELDEYITINGRDFSVNSPTGVSPARINQLNNKTIIHRARKTVVSGLRVYLGDINIPAREFQVRQPYIVLYSRLSFDEARTIYGQWDRWKYVKAAPNASPLLSLNPGSYRMHLLEANEIEEIKIYDAVNNEYSIILNGIPMFEQSTALPYQVMPDRRFNITMTIIKEMGTDFAYGKPPVASAKTLQALNDDTLRNLIRKFRQALEPPMGVKTSGKVYSKDIWEPGAVTQGVKEGDFSILNPTNTGITQSEFNFHALIKRETEEFIGAGALQSGMATAGEQTAKEIETLQKNAIKNLGHIVAAYMRYKRDSAYLRLYNIIENFTSPTAKRFDKNTKQVHDIFQRFTINDATYSNGAKGKKVVEFMDRNLEPEERQAIFEYERQQDNVGKPVRIRIINRKLLLDTMIFWYMNVVSKQRDGSALAKILFQDTIKQAYDLANLTGRQLNPDKVINEFESVWNFKDMFMRIQATPQGPQSAQQAGQAGQPQVSQDEASKLSEQIGMMERTQTAQAMTEAPKGSAKRPSLEMMQ